MAKLYIIAGCNGAGKTSASFTLLPELLDCKEFVNADEIARGISPFNPESVAIHAGRLMLARIEDLLTSEENFAIETTLSSKSYLNLIKRAKSQGYETILVFFWLNSVELAIERVKYRVSEGGHHIPTDTIIRRYERGICNFFDHYKNAVDSWFLFDNSLLTFKLIAHGKNEDRIIHIDNIWTNLQIRYGK